MPDNKPRKIEIRVDDRTIHTFLAESFETQENRSELTLRAQRWQPHYTFSTPNPAIITAVPFAVSGGPGGEAGIELGPEHEQMKQFCDQQNSQLVPFAPALTVDEVEVDKLREQLASARLMPYDPPTVVFDGGGWSDMDFSTGIQIQQRIDGDLKLRCHNCGIEFNFERDEQPNADLEGLCDHLKTLIASGDCRIGHTHTEGNHT